MIKETLQSDLNSNAVLGNSKNIPEVINIFSSVHTELRMKCMLPRNVKMPIIVGILTFISMINII